ncbi:hypothetical protein [Thermoflexus hugenholtzii]
MNEAHLRIALPLLLIAPAIFCLSLCLREEPQPPIPVSQEDLRRLGFPFPPRAVFIDGYDLIPIRPTDILAFRFRLPAEDFPAFLRSLGFPEFRIGDFGDYDAPCIKGAKGEAAGHMFNTFRERLLYIPGWPTEEEVEAEPDRFFSCHLDLTFAPITAYDILVDQRDPRMYRVYVVWWNRAR